MPCLKNVRDLALAFAVDIATTFNAAKTEAEGNVELVVVGVVGLALLTFGVGALMTWARK